MHDKFNLHLKLNELYCSLQRVKLKLLFVGAMPFIKVRVLDKQVLIFAETLQEINKVFEQYSLDISMHNGFQVTKVG